MEYGLIGEKLSHSYSVEIHKAFSNYNYILKPIEKENLKDFILSKQYKGLNVTIPYKEEVIKYLDYVSPLALRIGAVNTIVNENGILKGYNTDYYGFKYTCLSSGIDFLSKKVLVLGSGGTSKTAKAVIEDLGGKIVLVSRKGEINYSNVYEELDAEIIVNTTPVGMYPYIEESIVDIDKFNNLYAVVDVIYNPNKTSIVLQAKKRGIKYATGLKMLVYQGAKASEFFTGKTISDDKINFACKIIEKKFANVVLIGMPGSGKTTIGKRLSQELNLEFVDIDAEIEKKYGKISEIFSEHGEECFRKIESEVVKEFSLKTGVVISTGGGVVLNSKNMDRLAHNGKIYFINRDLQKLAKDNRPLSNSLGLENIYNNRINLYKKYNDLMVDNNGNLTNAINLIKEDYLR